MHRATTLSLLGGLASTSTAWPALVHSLPEVRTGAAAVAYLAARAANASNWLSARGLNALRAHFTPLELCLAGAQPPAALPELDDPAACPARPRYTPRKPRHPPAAGAPPRLIDVDDFHRWGLADDVRARSLASPRGGGGGAEVPLYCTLNRQEGHAKPRVRDATPALFERLDLGALEPHTPAARRSMHHALVRLAAAGKRRVVVVGDSVMENMLLALLCDAMRAAPTPHLAAALTRGAVFAPYRQSPVVAGPTGTLHFAKWRELPPLPVEVRGADGAPRWVDVRIGFASHKNDGPAPPDEGLAAALLLELAGGADGVVLFNVGLHLHTYGSFAGTSVGPWLRALTAFARAGNGSNLAWWVDTTAQVSKHFP
jgi:hypothetical protein